MNHTATFTQKAFHFYTTIKAPALPPGITAMNPYQKPEVRKVVQQFLNKFYADNRKRIYVFGINPGRFGAGLTGVTFTDPVALRDFCGIPNDLGVRRELSSEFIYQFISRWGGVQKFYQDFFLTAVSPLGFLKEEINYNFYDHPALLHSLRPFLLQTIAQQLEFGANRKVAIILGAGKNSRAFEELNNEGKGNGEKFFEQVYALEHPRFIMQYRRKKVGEYVERYCRTFTEALKK